MASCSLSASVLCPVAMAPLQLRFGISSSRSPTSVRNGQLQIALWRLAGKNFHLTCWRCHWLSGALPSTSFFEHVYGPCSMEPRECCVLVRKPEHHCVDFQSRAGGCRARALGDNKLVHGRTSRAVSAFGPLAKKHSVFRF